MQPLSSRLEMHRLELGEFFRIAPAVCTLLGAIHERRLVHGSVSPAAVMVNAENPDEVSLIERDATAATSPDGPVRAAPAITPYISPEQTGRLSRTVDYRSDYYSLGCLFYEMLTGAPPVRSNDSLEIIHWHLARNAVAPSDVNPRVPAQLSRVVLRLMAKAPEDRYQSTTGILHDLRRCAREWAEKGTIDAFEPGSRDVPEQLLVSHKLYGRDQEIRGLLNAFTDVRDGHTSMLLVSGYAGIGKTSLIQELHKPIVAARGYFIAGKFDQVVRNIPYGALIQAFRGLAWQLLGEPEDRLDAWRERFRGALGANGGVLAEVIPEIELIIGRQEPPPPLGPTEAQNRFRYVLQNFVAAVAAQSHPLVLFLDDLQWVDGATLDVLHSLLTAPEIRHLLIIGAYRDNEVGPDHLLTWAIGRAEAAGARVQQVALAPLAPPDLARLLSETFSREPAAIEEVAALVHRKTGGNPFFVIQFLQALEQDRLVAFDRAQGRWTFAVEAIARAGFTDNIIDLMRGRIRRLSAAGQEALTLAACIGNTFDWQTFSIATRQPLDQAAAGLSEALQAGLLHLTAAAGASAARGAVYGFLHDRVQQAAYALIPDDRKQPVHLDVGRLLLAEYAGEIADERIFEIVSHLNLGAALITDAGERVRVARLNLAAGRKAKLSAAYQPAADHLEAALALTSDALWQSDYPLMFELYVEAAECQYLCGAFDRAEAYFAVLQTHAATPHELGRICCLRIVLYENQSRFAEAVARGRETLGLFGITLPVSEDGKASAIEQEIAAIGRMVAGRPIGSLLSLPIMTDDDTRLAMRILTSLWAPAYISGDALLARLISATMVRLSLEHGNTEDSAYGYVTHAITIGPMRGDYAAAYQWGQLALDVNERLGDTKRRAKIHQQFQAHVNLWRRPFATCIPHAREARRIGIETGDFTYAGYAAMSESWPALIIARNLERFVRDYTPTRTLLARLKMTDFLAAHTVILNWARALQGRTDAPQSLTDATFDEQAFVERYDGRNAFFMTFLYTAQLQIAVLLEDYERAHDAARRAREGALPGTIWPVLIDFWGGLALAGRFGSAGAQAQREDREQLTAAQQRLALLADHCPENFRGFSLLLGAEVARADGDLAEATRLGEEALAYARQTASLQQEALANELLGRICLARDREAQAASFIGDAHRCYAAWGAGVKVAQLERRYGRLVPGTAAIADPTVTPAAAPADRWSLDTATVVKLAHTIAVHMDVGGLLEQLMRLSLENAGADRAAFLIERDRQLVVAATASADPPDVRVGTSVPLDDATGLAPTIVRYVHRTGQDVVVDAPGSDHRFAGDPHLDGGSAKSILCLPVGRPGHPAGVLYLENNLTAHLFSPGRTETIRIIAAQTAISLDNARLYEQMKGEVERRTAAEQALRAALEELRGLKEQLEAENVYLQEEILTQHNFNEIVGNSAVLRDALRKVERVAPTDSTVLIVGETGSGKELFARAVHSRSRRKDRPLVKVNCGAIPPGLVESELFGHVKGAFTGAVEKRTGRFELANGGTIFLDEVGELPLEAQVKLLRVLQEQEFEPVGSSRTIRVSVRVIAATNRNLDQAVAEGTFRSDLLYRLNVFPIEVPPLRQRAADVELLAGFFVTGLARKLGKPIQGFSVRTMQRLTAYGWPGNVRELQNVIERAAILARGPVIEADELHLGEPAAVPPRSGQETLDQAQRAHILHVLSMTGGVVEGAKGAAAVLGLHANTLRSRMKKLGIPTGTRRPS